MTGHQYLGWVSHDLITYSRFKPLQVEFPELAGKVEGCDAALVTTCLGRWFPFGAAVIFVYKIADELSFTQIMAERDRLYHLVPKPGHLDVFEFYGALVLVFEKPLSPAKREELIRARRTSLLGRCAVDIYAVELSAGTVWSDQVPWLMRAYLEPMNEALGHRGDSPPLPPVEPGMGQRGRGAPVSVAGIGLITLMVAIHLGVHLDHDESFLLRLFRSGANHTHLVSEGERWRLISSIYLHASWPHLFFNMLFLFEFVRGVEVLFGGSWAIVLFVLTGIAGNLLQNAIHPTACGVGASGAVFGLAGVMVGVYITRKQHLTARYRAYLFMAVLWALWTWYKTFKYFDPNDPIAHWAHVGGFLAGIVVGLVLPFKAESKSPWGGRWMGTAAVTATVWSAVMVGVRWDWMPDNYTSVHDPHVRATYQYPVSWFRYSEKNRRTVVLNSGLGSAVMLEQHTQQIGGLFQKPEDEVRDLFEEYYRKVYDKRWVGRISERDFKIVTFESSTIPFAGGKGISLRFRSRLTWYGSIFSSTVTREFVDEAIYLPLSSGYLRVAFHRPAEDAWYYQAIFSRIRKSVVSLDTPAEKIDPVREVE